MILWPLLLLALVSCNKNSEDREYYQREEILEMASKGDPNLRVMIPPSLDKPLVDCKAYDPPCWGGYKIQVKGMEVIALEYQETKDAVKMARKLDAYRKGNWVFDDVVGEPVLERFVETHLKAVRSGQTKSEANSPE